MNTSVNTPDDPSTLWKSVGGHHWVATRHLIDHLFKPIETLLADVVKCQSPQRVLDIGCGAGSTTRAVSRHIAPGGCATGVDISDIMIEAAQQDAGEAADRTAFICADAATHDFDEGSVQMLISRFGIMFFEDPVRAFQNLRRAASCDARALFVAWRSCEENPFMTTAARAASPMVTLPEQSPDAPGQFAFADRQRVETILHAAGWHHVRVEPLDFECTFPASELVGFFTRLGPLGRIFPDLDEKTQLQLIPVVREAFDPFVEGDTVRFNAACWQIKARA